MVTKSAREGERQTKEGFITVEGQSSRRFGPDPRIAVGQHCSPRYVLAPSSFNAHCCIKQSLPSTQQVNMSLIKQNSLSKSKYQGQRYQRCRSSFEARFQRRPHAFFGLSSSSLSSPTQNTSSCKSLRVGICKSSFTAVLLQDSDSRQSLSHLDLRTTTSLCAASELFAQQPGELLKPRYPVHITERPFGRRTGICCV